MIYLKRISFACNYQDCASIKYAIISIKSILTVLILTNLLDNFFNIYYKDVIFNKIYFELYRVLFQIYDI